MFPLHPETPAEGSLLEDLFDVSEEQISKMIANLKKTADRLGLPFGERHMTYNSRLAQELGKWAEECGKERLFHHHAFRLYFEHGKNIAQPSVLLELAELSNLSVKDAQQVLHERTYAKAVDQDWQRSRDNHIQAVPSFKYGEKTLVGGQSYEKLVELVTGKTISPFPTGF